MKKIFLMLFLTIGTTYIFSQVNFNNQVLVYFKTGAQRVAPANTTSNITSQNILNVLSTYSIPTSNVIPSFPSFNEADTVLSEIGETSRQMNRAKVFTVTVTNSATMGNLINDLNNLAEVLYAEANGTASTDIIPIDARFGQQWGMRNTVVPGADIHLDGATNIFTGNPNSIIAIIDNGVDRLHNDLDAKIIGGDIGFEVRNDPLGRPFNHGTHVAGIAAAISNNNNNNGVAGVDWAARIHPKNIFDGNGDPDITQSIIDAVNFNTNVWTFNNSWGTLNRDGSPGRYSVTIRSAFAHAYKNNRVSCIAMGNHQNFLPGVPAFPASINSGVISVGATDINDNIAGFSGQGLHIDVSAPGVGIWSTNFNNNYIDEPGTSMATPHVAGLASLLKGFNTNLANDDIEQIIRLSADDVNAANGFPGFDNQMGTGRINAERALQFLQAPNTVQQLSVTGGTVFSTGASIRRIFLGVPRLPDAAYLVKRSEVRTNIIFPAMCNIIGVWGRGVGTTGYREENGRNFGEGICEVVPGTLTNTGCTLRTWVYEVWAINGQYLGFYPQAANNVIFQYTILGTPAPNTINGDNVACATSNPYTINNLNGASSVSWTINPSAAATINTPNAPQTTITRNQHNVATLTATITNACGAGTQTLVVTKPNITLGKGATFIVFNNCTITCNPNGAYLYANIQPIANGTTCNWYSKNNAIANSQFVFLENAPWGTDYPLRTKTRKYTIRAEVINACGTLIGDQVISLPNCTGGGGGNRIIIASPNPVTNSISIQMTDEQGKVSVDPNDKIYELQIVDKLGTLYKQIKFNEGVKQPSINISNLKPDIYFIKAFNGTDWLIVQIIKQ